MDESDLICGCCQTPLVVKNATLEYLGHHFNVDLPQCPCCGFIYIPEALARGKVAEVEAELEDK